MDVDASVDDARAAIAAALGHPGWFARVYYNGIGGELEGSTPLRESGYVEGDTCVVTAYTRPKPPPRPPHPPVSHTSPSRAPHAHVARRPMPASPGFRTRNYIRENEDEGDDDGDEWEDVDADPLAAPVGRNARAPAHSHDVDDDEEGAEEGAEGHTAVSTSALAEEIWAELVAEARSTSARALVEDAPPAPTALEVSDDDGDTFAIAETPPESSVPKKRRRRGRTAAKPEPESLKRLKRLKLDPEEPADAETQGLPPALERLAVGYHLVATMSALVQSQRVRPTWRLVRSMIPDDVGGCATVTETDLTLMSALCPGSLQLTRRSRIADVHDEDAADPFNEFMDRAAPDVPSRSNAEGEGHETETDLLLSVTEPGPGRTACDLPGRHGRSEPGEGAPSPMQDVVHGYRTGRATYGFDDDPRGGADDRGFPRDEPPTMNPARKANARGDGAVRRRVDAFRAGLGLLVIAQADATRAETGTGHDPWESVNAAPVSVFVARAEAERGSTGVAEPLIREETIAKRKGRGGSKKKGGRACRCHGLEPLSVDAFISHLTAGTDSLGGQGQCEHRLDIPARITALAPKGSEPPPLRPATVAALAATGVPLDPDDPNRLRLFSHQHEGIAAALGGANVCVATGTASGKSVCYNAPVLDALLHDTDATALYLFPTKALAQDQIRALRVMLDGASTYGGETHAPEVGVYDGDTRTDERERIRNECRLVITNPDMLHVGFLPAHKRWARVFKGLKYVVLDEAHVYCGVFGSHVSLVVRRLRRIARELYGVDPRFIVTSATIANPHEHAVALVGDMPTIEDEDAVRPGGFTGGEETNHSFRGTEWEIVDEDGSPSGDKTFLMWNPPVREAIVSKWVKAAQKKAERTKPRGKAAVAARLRAGNGDKTGEDPRDNPGAATAAAMRAKARAGGAHEDASTAAIVTGIRSKAPRSSPIIEVAALLAECVRHDLKCIAFCKTKKLCELVLRYCREILRDTGAGHLTDSVAAYRGGYSAQDRRAVEGALFGGALRGVAATNALELGVDVGYLDCTLHLGFPGTVASLVQQSGRAGRRGKRALGVYVAFDGALDQYFMRDPKRLFKRPIERAAVDPENVKIMRAHAQCAAHEIPLDPRVSQGNKPCGAIGVDARVYFGAVLGDVCESLRHERKLTPAFGMSGGGSDPRLVWCGGLVSDASRGPANGVSIRTIEEERYRIVDEASGAVIEEVEASKAFWEVYPGAVYLNQARTYLCKSLNVGSRTAVVRLADVKYFTGTVDMTTVTLVQHGAQTHAYPHRPGPTHRPAQFDGTTAQCAECEIRVAFSAYHKIWQGTGQVFDTVGLSLPDVVYRTRAAWIRVPDAARRECDNLGLDFRAGVHAATHAVINALPLFLMVNQSDCGAECDDPQRKHYKPTRVLIFDRQPGGVGIAERAAPMFPKLLRAAVELIEECRDCRGEDEAEGGGDGNGDGNPTTSASLSMPAGDRSGCPGCVHYLACDVYNVALDRAAALVVLRSIMDAEETTFGAHQCEADDGGGTYQCEADDGGGGFDFAAGSDLDRCACCANGRHGKKTRGGV